MSLAMGMPSTSAHASYPYGLDSNDYSRYQFTFTGPATSSSYAPFSPQYPSYRITQRGPMMYQEPSSWWMSPSGLSLTAFPGEASATPYSNVPLQFHLSHAGENEGSSSRTRFGGNTTEVPSSPSDSIISTDTSPSPAPEYVHVVCNAPLVAPKPLPYHSPTFLQFDLPDDDEDLSHPPYVFRPHKRKREEDEDEDDRKFVMMKRRPTDGTQGRWNSGAVAYPYVSRPPPRSHAMMPAAGLGQYAQRRR